MIGNIISLSNETTTYTLNTYNPINEWAEIIEDSGIVDTLQDVFQSLLQTEHIHELNYYMTQLLDIQVIQFLFQAIKQALTTVSMILH